MHCEQQVIGIGGRFEFAGLRTTREVADTVVRWVLNLPVMMLARVGEQTQNATYPRVNRMPRFASESIYGDSSIVSFVLGKKQK